MKTQIEARSEAFNKIGNGTPCAKCGKSLRTNKQWLVIKLSDGSLTSAFDKEAEMPTGSKFVVVGEDCLNNVAS